MARLKSSSSYSDLFSFPSSGSDYNNYDNKKEVVKKKITLRDTETGDLYDISVKNGELVCVAQDPDVRRENRFKKLLDDKD